MESFKKWFYKPKKGDTSLLAQFFYADEALNLVTAELDSFDGRKDPERCTLLVNRLRQCQDTVLNICNKIMNQLIRSERAARDFRVKFPDDVMQENLAGQLWFGAECLAAGSSIMNRERESSAMRPLAKALTKSLENVRNLLREQCFRTNANIQTNNHLFNDKLLEALKIFDRLFAEFELRYVSAMVPVKTPREYFLQQLVVVLFSETLMRALNLGLLTQDMVDDMDPALMFTIPRLAIVSGLLVFHEGPICLNRPPSDMSEMFRPFRTLLHKIRTLLGTLNSKELFTLEKLLCSCEDPNIDFTENNSYNKVDEEQEETIVPQEKELDYESISGDEEAENTRVPQEKELDYEEEDSLPVDEVTVQTNLQPDAQPAPVPIPAPAGFLTQNQVTLGNLIVGHSPPDEDHDSLTLVTDTLSSFLNTNEEQSDNQQAQHRSSNSNNNNNNNSNNTNCSCANDTSPDSLISPDSGLSTMENTLSDQSPDEKASPSTSKVPGQDTRNDKNESEMKTLGEGEGGVAIEETKQTWEGPEESKSTENAQDTVSLDVPSRFVIVAGRETDRDTSYRIRTTTLSPMQNFESEHSPVKPDTVTVPAPSRRRDNIKRRRFQRPKSYATASRDSTPMQIPSHSKRLSGVGTRVTGPGSFSSSCSSCLTSDTWSLSSDTSSYNSELQDDEEITLALQAAEAASRDETRSRFRSSEDLIHRLFVCIAGVADQLQTNFAGDLRNILKAVFAMNATQGPSDEEDSGECSPNHSGDSSRIENAVEAWDHTEVHEQEELNVEAERDVEEGGGREEGQERVKETEDPPPWVPDTMAPRCMTCEATFTLVRRRHHCRNCGKVFCAKCSSNSVPLPRYGHLKPVRVCNVCFLYRVTPFTMDEIPTST